MNTIEGAICYENNPKSFALQLLKLTLFILIRRSIQYYDSFCCIVTSSKLFAGLFFQQYVARTMKNSYWLDENLLKSRKKIWTGCGI